MDLTHIIILLAAGVGVGLASGLLGLGGAFIMTPVQYVIYTQMGLSPDLAVRLAFGTNLLVILPTAASGAWRHHLVGFVNWRVAFVMGGVGLVCAAAGSTLTTHLPGTGMKLAYGIIVLVSAIRMLLSRAPRVEDVGIVSNPWVWAAWAVPIGVLSGMFGFGGAIVMIPIMVIALRFQMHEAVATSLAIMIFSSIGGIISYIVNGLHVPGLPPYTLGYINLPVWFILVLTSIVTAQVGALLSRRLKNLHLRYLFVVIMFYMGLKLVGLFTWLGWPL